MRIGHPEATIGVAVTADSVFNDWSPLSVRSVLLCVRLSLKEDGDPNGFQDCIFQTFNNKIVPESTKKNVWFTWLRGPTATVKSSAPGFKVMELSTMTEMCGDEDTTDITELWRWVGSVAMTSSRSVDFLRLEFKYTIEKSILKNSCKKRRIFTHELIRLTGIFFSLTFFVLLQTSNKKLDQQLKYSSQAVNTHWRFDVENGPYLLRVKNLHLFRRNRKQCLPLARDCDWSERIQVWVKIRNCLSIIAEYKHQ